MNIAELV